MTDGNVPTLGFVASAIGYVVLLGFSPVAAGVPGPDVTADYIVVIPADDLVVRMP